MTGKMVVLSTCGSREEAEKVGSALVEKRLAACVTVIDGATSFYRWQGVVERATEYLLIIKTRRDLFQELAAELQSLHSYEVPEAIALTIVEGSSAYLDWIDNETLDRPSDPEPTSLR